MSLELAETLDLNTLLNDGRHFSEKRGGLIHIIDSLTGNTVAAFPTGGNLPQVLKPSTLPNGTIVFTPLGANIVSGGVREITFNPVIIDLICQQIVEGRGLTEVCKQPDMPSYNVLMQWRRKHDWIDEHLNRARQDRAEQFRDKAIAEADSAESRDPGTAHALRVETYKWAAGVDSSRYSPKSKVEATVNMPMQIIVHTGIDRSGGKE